MRARKNLPDGVLKTQNKRNWNIRNNLTKDGIFERKSTNNKFPENAIFEIFAVYKQLKMFEQTIFPINRELHFLGSHSSATMETLSKSTRKLTDYMIILIKILRTRYTSKLLSIASQQTVNISNTIFYGKVVFDTLPYKHTGLINCGPIFKMANFILPLEGLINPIYIPKYSNFNWNYCFETTSKNVKTRGSSDFTSLYLIKLGHKINVLSSTSQF